MIRTIHSHWPISEIIFNILRVFAICLYPTFPQCDKCKFSKHCRTLTIEIKEVKK